ncbi:flagellar hook-associated protein FlgL [Defluviitalea phaphyphila]|uniref:flagellar hook-associated protein FlgL n=1 Tax=Defluviitalea phaphyphila TaxID=1473580 RepID=UPI00073124ED|nr:flagellar hook-associated protein FlgL [Defluviitalea phaphyphila]
MRITNNMMINNTLLSLNRNMEKLDTLYMQMTTLKKIQRPSDDPIIAGRALKFRTRISETQQFQSNVEQALSWMSSTETAIDNIESILQDMRTLANQGANDTLGISEQKDIVDQLEELKKQLINEGNVTYEGNRYIFSGFRTDTKLVYDEDNTENFRITQSFTKDDIEEISVPGDNMYWNSSLPDPTSNTPPTTAYRIRLGYDDVTLNSITGLGLTVTAMDSTSSTPDAYAPPAGEVYFLEDTGEIIFNSADISSIPDFTVQYDKQDFKEGDLNPIFYFECEDLATGEVYNSPFDLDKINEKIEYEVGINNKIEVNVLGKDILTTDLMRDIDEIVKLVSETYNAQVKAEELSKEGEDGEKIAEFIKNSMPNISEAFTELIGKLDKHLSQVSTERAGLGSRMKRLELINNRLEDDELNFQELNNDNEGIDLEEVYTEFSMQQVIYNSALNATARIIQPTLLDFIQ